MQEKGDLSFLLPSMALRSLTILGPALLLWALVGTCWSPGTGSPRLELGDQTVPGRGEGVALACHLPLLATCHYSGGGQGASYLLLYGMRWPGSRWLRVRKFPELLELLELLQLLLAQRDIRPANATALQSG